MITETHIRDYNVIFFPLRFYLSSSLLFNLPLLVIFAFSGFLLVITFSSYLLRITLVLRLPNGVKPGNSSAHITIPLKTLCRNSVSTTKVIKYLSNKNKLIIPFGVACFSRSNEVPVASRMNFIMYYHQNIPSILHDCLGQRN